MSHRDDIPRRARIYPAVRPRSDTLAFTLTIYIDERQVGGLTRTIPLPRHLPRAGETVDVFDVSDDEPPMEPGGAYTPTTVDDVSWSANLDAIIVDLSLELGPRASSTYAREVADWLSQRGWDDWWNRDDE